MNVSQVFLGVNLKCASCHDSFVNDWALADAYGVAAVYADAPLELVHCDKPTGKRAGLRFLYPEIGAFDADAPKTGRMKRLAEIVTSPANGRLSRTLVNRLWARLLGRGLVEPLDDMDRPAWNPDVLDWLAEDFAAHGCDVKHVLETICTSRSYQLPTVGEPGEKEDFVFRGPFTRRMTAEQFSDAIGTLSGVWDRLPSSLEFDFIANGLVSGVRMPQWVWTDEPVELGPQREAARHAAEAVAPTSAMRLRGFARAARNSIAAAAAKLTTAKKTASEPLENVEPSIKEARWRRRRSMKARRRSGRWQGVTRWSFGKNLPCPRCQRRLTPRCSQVRVSSCR